MMIAQGPKQSVVAASTKPAATTLLSHLYQNAQLAIFVPTAA